MNWKMLSAIAAGLALVCAPMAAAQDAAPLALGEADETCTAISATQDEDQAIVAAAMSTLQQRGYGPFGAHLPALRGVVERAPACYPEVTRRGDIVIMRNDPDQAMVLMTLMTAATEGRNTSVDVQPNTYPLAFLLLASYDVEARNYDQALIWLDRGLALQPNNQHLNFEKGAALMGARRFQEAATLFQWMLDNPMLELSLDRSRLYRNLGVVLIDLNRLDDAEAALNESIRLEPNNPGARGELEYIAGLRGGEARRDLTLTAPAATPPTQSD